MLERDQKYVALFIDWDNLVISTAADLGGAIPDVKRIVQKAQQYGTILLAKAYAEWTSTSDKLMVYRAGVEPAYAPTFRFEAEATTRGKSLADPCLVADIVDSFHLHPHVSTYVIVTGDKDLIPVVRLAQLRGKRVVVIGPDLVAGVLRDMADDFVSYRKLVEIEGGRPMAEISKRHVPTTYYGAGEHAQGETLTASKTGMGRTSTGIVTTTDASGRVGLRKARGETKIREEDRPIAPATMRKEIVGEPIVGSEPSVAARGVSAPTSLREAQSALEKPTIPDINSVYSGIVEILQQRATEGKLRMRATNLKDALMQKISGFSERRYGFSKFKDLLIAAEAAGFVKVRVAGPVHWVSLPDRGEETEELATPATTEIESEVTESVDKSEIPQLVEFIQNLRERSRWLTYTYLLTNLISHFAKRLPQAAAEARARATLNCLVQEGVLRIDKEPQEVDVAGAKHRVRMCHLEELNPVVAEVLERWQQRKTESESSTAENDEMAAATALGTKPTAAELETVMVSKEAAEEPGESTENGHEHDETPVEHAPQASISEAPTMSKPIEMSEQPQSNGAVEKSVVTENEAPDTTTNFMAIPEAQSASVENNNTPEANEEQVTEVESKQEIDATESASKPDLEQVFKTLADLVRENTGPRRPRMGAAGLKIKLGKALGSFEERVYGFNRFKDFLVAAEKRGYVHLDLVGQITWVLPVNGIEGEDVMP